MAEDTSLIILQIGKELTVLKGWKACLALNTCSLSDIFDQYRRGHLDETEEISHH